MIYHMGTSGRETAKLDALDTAAADAEYAMVLRFSADVDLDDIGITHELLLTDSAEAGLLLANAYADFLEDL